MKDLVGKFTGAGSSVLDFCASSFLTAMVYMLLGQYKEFVHCDFDSEVLNAAEPDLLLTNSLEVLSPSPEIVEGEELKAAARGFKEKTAVAVAHRRATAREVARELDATQVKPGHILHFLCRLYES